MPEWKHNYHLKKKYRNSLKENQTGQKGMFAWQPLSSLSSRHPSHCSEKSGIKQSLPHCPEGVNFFNIGSSGWRHFFGHFPLVLQCNSSSFFFFFYLSRSPLHFSPATAVCGRLNCVLLPSRRKYHYHIFAVKGLQRMVLSWASVI